MICNFFRIIFFLVLMVSTAFAGPLEDGRAAYGREDYKAALKLLQPLAENGNAEAEYVLGNLYFYGHGVAKNKAEGLKWWTKSGEHGHVPALTTLTMAYTSDWFGLTKDEAEASKWFGKAKALAEGGNADAMESIANLYSYGTGVKRDDAEALRWRTTAAEQGNLYSQYSLALAYTNGNNGAPKDESQAAKWFQKVSEAAERGDAYAAYLLSALWRFGKKNDAEADKWRRKAAELGNQQAKKDLEKRLEADKKLELGRAAAKEEKWEEALKHFDESLKAEMDYPPAKEEREIAEKEVSRRKAAAAVELGLAAAKRNNWDLAIRHFSAAQKESPAYPPALFNLALAYDSAKGRELIALCWFRAYLEADPEAANAEQVRKRVAELEIAFEDNMRKLARTAADSVIKLPENPPLAEADFESDINYTFTVPQVRLAGTSVIKRSLLEDAAEALARAGDIDGAYRAVEKISPEDEGIRNMAYRDMVWALAKAGDIDNAAAANNKISKESDRLSEKDIKNSLPVCSSAPSGGWTSRAIYLAGDSPHPSVRNLSAFLSDIKGLSVMRTARKLMGAVEEMARALQEVRACKKTGAP